MTLRSWIRQLFARPVTRPVRKDPARCRPAIEALEDDALPTITFQPSGGKAKQHPGFSAPKEQAPESLVHTGRFSPLTIGFWLGGAGMGMGGCLMGALMPYRHPVAVAISVLWWGIYFGCFGASVGALVGVLTDRAPPRPGARWDGAGKIPTELELDSRAAHTGSRAGRADQAPGPCRAGEGLPGGAASPGAFAVGNPSCAPGSLSSPCTAGRPSLGGDSP
jgi:hypothetical protein